MFTLSIVITSFLIGIAFWTFWQWWIPALRTFTQRPIEKKLCRAGQLGLNEKKLRIGMFVMESFVFAMLIWFTIAYAGLILGSTVLAIILHLRSLILGEIVERREKAMRQQTLSFASGLAGLVRGGLSLWPSIDILVKETPAPLGSQVSRISNDYHRGRPLTESLNAVRSSLRLDAFSLLVTSITCSHEQGSPISEALSGVQEALEHRDQAERQLSAKTANARRTILILACTPPCFFLLFWFMQPDAMELVFTTSLGKRMLAGMLGLLYGGVAWAKHLATIQ